MAVSAVPINLDEVIERLQALLRGLRAAYEVGPTQEGRSNLTNLELIIEDLMDLRDAATALDGLTDADFVPWEEVEAELGP